MAGPRHERCLECLPNLAKERPCLQEIARFNAVSKPAIYRREHVDCFLSFALIGIKPGSSDAGAQFDRLCALIGSNFDRVPEGRVSFFAAFLGCVEQQKLAAFQLEHGVTPALLASLRNLSRIGQQLEPSRALSSFAMDAGEQAKIVRHTQPGAGLAKLLQGRIVSREPLSDSACFCDRPGPHKRAPRSVVVEPVFLAQAARFLRRFESPLWLTPELMEHGQVSQCKRDTERVRDFASKRQ